MTLPNSRKTLCSRYLKLTEDEQKSFSAITPEVKHSHDIWLQNHRKAEMKAEDVDGLGDVYTQRIMSISNNDETVVAGNTLYLIGLRTLAEAAARHIPDKQATIIEVGAGDGELGVKLKQVGFTKIDALEPTEQLVKNMPKDVYGKVYTECVYADKPTSIPSDTYDHLLAAGALLPDHIEVEAVPELIRIIKPGGYIIFNIPDFWLKNKDYGARLDAMLQSLLEDGTLESVLKKRSVFFYDTDDCDHYIVKTSSKK